MPALDLVPVAALLALLVTAYAHPSGRVEAGVGVLAALATLATGILAWSDVEDTLRHLGPVVLFLVTILVVADVCARAGLFAAAAARVRDAGGGRAVPIFTGVFLLAAAVTAVLSLDATVVLLTPVVVAAAVSSGTSYRPGAHACLRMANSASLLLPGLQPHQPAGDAAPRPDLRRVRPGDGAGARGRAGRGVRRAAAALPPRPRRAGRAGAGGGGGGTAAPPRAAASSCC